MGMFDYFNIDVSILPMVPKELKVGDDGRYTFQTKDTSLQTMATYVQDRGFALKLKQTSGEYVPGEPVDESADDITRLLSSLGSYVVHDTWYEDQMISGVIRFYTNLRHEADDRREPDRYVDGWIEYFATYRGGMMVSIVVAEHTHPQVLTDEQIIAKRKEIERSRAEYQTKLIKQRAEHPTREQRLIDTIYNCVNVGGALYDETDLMLSLNDIKQLIKEYRESYDIHYRSPN